MSWGQSAEGGSQAWHMCPEPAQVLFSGVISVTTRHAYKLER